MCCYCGWRGTWWGSWGTKGKNSWKTALDQGFTYSSLLLNKGTLKTKDILQSPRYDCIRDAAWMLARQNVSMWQTSEFNHILLVWFDKVWWGHCSVSGADLAWFGQGKGGLLLWSGSPCGEREEQKATRPPLLQEQLQRAADIFWLCKGRQPVRLPIRWGLGIEVGVGEGINGGRKLGFACNYCTLWPTSSFLSLAAEIHSSSLRLVCEWDFMHHFSCMARGRLSLLPDAKINKSILSPHSLLFVSYCVFLACFSMTSQLGEAGILDEGGHLRLLQVPPGYLVLWVVPQRIMHDLSRPKWTWPVWESCRCTLSLGTRPLGIGHSFLSCVFFQSH